MKNKKGTEEDYFKGLMYTENNEDLEFIIKNLSLKNGNRVALVTSSGCVAFAASLFRPLGIFGFDVNEAQTAYACLRKAAYKILSWEDSFRFFGYRSCTAGERLKLYERVKGYIPCNPVGHFDNNLGLIKEGIVNQSYFYRKMDAVAKAGKTLNKPLLRPLIKVVGGLKKCLPSKTLRRRAENYDIGELMINGAEEPFAKRIFTNDKEFIPPFLDKTSYRRMDLGCMEFFTKSMNAGLRDIVKCMWSINRFYLSNIIDYMAKEQSEELFSLIEEKADDGAIILSLQRTNNFSVADFVKGTKLEIERDDLAKESRAVAYCKNQYAKIILLRKRY